MSIQVQVKVDAEKTRRAFKKAPETLGRNIGSALKKSAFLVERLSKLEAPVITGTLRGSIATEIRPFTAVIAPHVNYAVFVHEGHSQQVGRYVPAIGKRLVKPFVQGNPFMERAAKGSERDIERFFGEAVDNTLKTIDRES